jgi:hypothetical protein
VVLGEFVKQPWDTLTLAAPSPQQLRNEVEELIDLIEHRPGVLQESVAQRDGLLDYFRGVLAFNKDSHPSTFLLAEVALRVGQFRAMHYKHKLEVPRPSYLAPALMPPIDPPGHPSYPSAHATDAWLAARALKEIVPVEAHAALDRIAERLARNREVLGVH